jgi:hypothetical protein
MKMTDEWGEPIYKKCNNPMCQRITTIRSAFCCAACGAANDGRYEIHEDGPLGHSNSCNERHLERGEFVADDDFKSPRVSDERNNSQRHRQNCFC